MTPYYGGVGVTGDRRFGFEALMPVVRARYRPNTANVSSISDVGMTVAVTGVNRTTVHLWRRDGLSPLQADRAAVMLGLHPSEVWPEWFADALPEPTLLPELPEPSCRPCGPPAVRRHRRKRPNGQLELAVGVDVVWRELRAEALAESFRLRAALTGAAV